MSATRSDEPEHRRRLAIVGRRLAELSARLASAQLVDPNAQAHDKVRFGAIVTLRTVEGAQAGEERRIQIVGVDEADPAQGKVAFTTPMTSPPLRLTSWMAASVSKVSPDWLTATYSASGSITGLR